MERTNEEAVEAVVTCALLLMVCGLAMKMQKVWSKSGRNPFLRNHLPEPVVTNVTHDYHHAFGFTHLSDPPSFIDVCLPSPLMSIDTLSCPRPVIRPTRTSPISVPATSVHDFLSPVTAYAPLGPPIFPMAFMLWLVAALATAVLYANYLIRKVSSEPKSCDMMGSLDGTRLQLSCIQTTISTGDEYHLHEEAAIMESQRRKIEALESQLKYQTLKHQSRIEATEQRIHHLDEAMRAGKQLVQSLEHQLADNQKSHIAKMDKQLKTHTEAIKIKDEVIRTLESRLEKQALEYDSRLSTKEEQISDDAGTIQSQQATIQSLTSRLDAQVSQYEELLASSHQPSHKEGTAPTESEWDKIKKTGDLQHIPPAAADQQTPLRIPLHTGGDKQPNQQPSVQSTAQPTIILGGHNNRTIRPNVIIRTTEHGAGGMYSSIHAGGTIPRSPCKFYLQGRCKFLARDCKNGPHTPVGKRPVCRKYMEGDCYIANGACQYNHPEGVVPACKRHRNGLCIHNAEECSYAHNGGPPKCGFMVNGVCQRMKSGLPCAYSHPSGL